jgi:predicted DNA-binding transcriptional regulator YafY
MVKRLSPYIRLATLAVALRRKRSLGMSLDEIAAEIGLSRRSADRYRTALATIFPDMAFWTDSEGVRRWYLPSDVWLTPRISSEILSAIVEGAATHQDVAQRERLLAIAERLAGRRESRV